MNLFLTVGTQLPFDRLTRAVDDWAGRQERRVEIFGQVGPLSPRNHRPAQFEWAEFLDPDAFAKRFDAATHVVAHAGMGTIISALVAGKPVALLARHADLGEQRNDHQIATLRQFRNKPGIWVAERAEQIPEVIDAMVSSHNPTAPRAEAHADPSLTNAIRAEIMA